MPDRYQQLVNTRVGRVVSKRVGLPSPPELERYAPGQPVISGPVLLNRYFGRPDLTAARLLAATAL